MQRFLTPLTAVCLLALAPAIEASPYSGLVVFGDSLSDAGQFPDSGGPAGSTLRFTNRVGPTYQNGSGEPFAANATMRLSERLGLGALSGSTSPVNLALGLPDGSNYAVGGNTTEQILDSITGRGDGSVVETAGGDTLRVRNGYLQDVAISGQTLDPSTLFYVNGGGNDFLDLLVLSRSDARQSATRLGDSVRALQGAGARYILVPLLGDLSQTPFALGSGLSGFIEPLVAEFNNELVSQLAGIDAQIIPLNLPLLVSEVVNNASAYGLDPAQNLLGSCFDGSANNCLENPTYGLRSGNADPTRLLFNDGVHPTSTGQQITADYAYSLLAAPDQLTLLPEMAHSALRAQQAHLRTQWLADWADWQPLGQWRSFVSGGAQRQDVDRKNRSTRFSNDGDNDSYSLSLGGSYRPGAAWRVGLALGLDKQQLDAEASEYELRSYLLTTFAQYQQGHWWADVAASAGTLDYADLQRGFAIGQAQRSEKGDSSGDIWAFSARLGVDFAQPDSRWHLSPFVSADYARVEVDGYAEQGTRATALTFGDQERTSKRLGVGLQGRLAFSRSTQVFAEVAHEREYENDPSELTLALNSLPTLDFTLPGYTPQERVNRASIGFNQQLTRELALRGSYSLRKAEGEDDRQQGVSLSLAWNW